MVAESKHGLSRGGCMCYIANEERVKEYQEMQKVLEAMNTLLLDGEIDARWNLNTREYEVVKRTDWQGSKDAE